MRGLGWALRALRKSGCLMQPEVPRVVRALRRSGWLMQPDVPRNGGHFPWRHAARYGSPELDGAQALSGRGRAGCYFKRNPARCQGAWWRNG